MNKKKVLFLCTGNSCRSQIAEGYLKYLAGDKFQVFSAGTKPTHVNSLAVQVMAEEGIDINNHTSKSVSKFNNETFDYVITVCGNAKDTCPIFLNTYKQIHWNIEDPAGFSGSCRQKIEFFRKTRDKIKKLILDFLQMSV